jgi:hypothetical protein
MTNLRPHRYGCRCGDDGRCEQAALALRDEADRRACSTTPTGRTGERNANVRTVR